MNLLQTSFLTFIATAIKILVGIVINKAVSVFIGPSGVALIGQFQNSSQFAMTIAQGGINSGVTKYTAEYGMESDKLPELWSTAARITLFCSAVVGVALIVGAKYISDVVLKTDQYTYVFIIFGFTIILFSVNNLLLSILNGLKEIRIFIVINITQSIISLIFTTLLIIKFKLDGALIALVTNQSIVFFTILWWLRKHKLITLDSFKRKLNNKQTKKLLSYSVMALTSACTVSISLLVVRNYIGENLSWNAAGYWQSMWYISSMYLMVITTVLSIYYLPRLSEITSKAELRKELKNGYLMIIPVVIVLSLAIYFLREFIVLVLFTEDFKPMLVLFKWQLIGDVIKISAWLFSYLMLAKSMTKSFILVEVVFACLFVLLSIYLVDDYGLVGMSYAYTLSYIMFFLGVLLVTRKVIF